MHTLPGRPSMITAHVMHHARTRVHTGARQRMMPLQFAFMLGAVLLCGVVPTAQVRAQEPSNARENLGSHINSVYDEVLPIISPDGKTLYFVRKDDPANVGGPKDDIWFSTLGADGIWSTARNIGAPLNTSGYNYVCYAFPDNNSLLLGNQYFDDGSQSQGVSMSVRGAFGWQKPVNFNFEGFANKSKNSEYTISPDGQVMLMSIEGPVTYGGRDIYVSFRVRENMWSEPRNLGLAVNSTANDITPFLAPDGVTLYFSSARAGGFGSNDVYMTRRLDSTWREWTEPKNLGWPINTAGWDAYYTVPASGEYAYFVSTEGGEGRSDLFRIRLPKDMAPEPILLVIGTVRNTDGEVVPARVLYERLSDNRTLGTAYAHPQTGEFTLALPAGEIYGFRAEYDGYYPESQNLDLRELGEYTEVRKDLILRPITAGTTVRLNNIFFDFNQAVLRPESMAEITRLKQFLDANPSITIEIGGHTDNVGSDAYNLELSQRRADAVVSALVAMGIEPARVRANGYGESRPIDTNDTDDGRQMNRRVEFTVL